MYYRVECVLEENDKTMGGYMCAIMMLLALRLGISPDVGDEEFSEAISKSRDHQVTELMMIISELGEIPQPEIYVNDKQNYVCLYTELGFEDALNDLADLSDILVDNLRGKFGLYYKIFELEPEEILYEDSYQVVISKDVYNERKECDCYTPIEFTAAVRKGLIDLDEFDVDEN